MHHLLHPRRHRRPTGSESGIAKKRTSRRLIRRLAPIALQESRPFVHGEDVLPPLTYDEWGSSVPSRARCHAIGLEKGDCRQARTPDSLYCYYHDKLQRGVLDPSVPTPEDLAVGDNRPGMALYPVWPLPAGGYVLETESPRRLAVA